MHCRSVLRRPRLAWWVVLWLAALAVGPWAQISDAALPVETATPASGYTGEDLECDVACQEAQKAMLLGLYAATGGRDWTVQQGWVEADALSHCGFFGKTALVRPGCLCAFLFCCLGGDAFELRGRRIWSPFGSAGLPALATDSCSRLLIPGASVG